MKPDRSALTISNYPFTVEIPTRFGDLDPLQHVNNVAIAGLFEESRVRFGLLSRGKTLQELRDQGRLVAVATTLHYLAEVLYPDPVIVAVGVKHIGRTSYTLGCLMHQGDKAVAYSVTTLVHTKNAKSSPLPDLLVQTLATFMINSGCCQSL